jgi:hypothetical protein
LKPKEIPTFAPLIESEFLVFLDYRERKKEKTEKDLKKKLQKTEKDAIREIRKDTFHL